MGNHGMLSLTMDIEGRVAILQERSTRVYPVAAGDTVTISRKQNKAPLKNKLKTRRARGKKT